MKNITMLAAVVFFMGGAFAQNTVAQQQQYSNAYAYWDFGRNSDDVENIDQKIRVVKPAPATQWVILWNWVADPAHGGYLGFNTDDQGKGQALFSLWNADNANGGNCQKFGGEGEGLSCRMPFEVNPDTVYQLRLARTKVEAQGVWWSAWIIENAGSGSPTEHFLGEIRVKPQMNHIRGNSIMNFSEYYGKVVEKCSMVPLSILAVAPPAANKEKNGENYAHNSRRNGQSNPNDNPCKSGDEAAGNLFRVDDYNFFGAGAIVFAGATPDEYNLPEGRSKNSNDSLKTETPKQTQAPKKDVERPEKGEDVDETETVRIYVGNLSPETTEEILREAFEEFGEVKSVKLERDANGKSIGFGYVEMAADEAEEAISKLNGSELNGKKIQVKKVERPKLT